MLVDDITIQVAAGNGGDGAVAFNRNKNELGPSGARGGDGGNVYIEGVADLGALRQYRFKKNYRAAPGQHGGHQFTDGKNGTDITLTAPVGTVIHFVETGSRLELLKIGERILIARGGSGGKGNFMFRSSRNTTPQQFQTGTYGEAYTLRLELKLIADIGLIGLPNAGKSSMLNELTRANAKVANYPFTTLEPNLGVYFELILADIPGLIEGASEGRGLGTKFLRHIERTGILFHFISCESNDPAKDYMVVREELKRYNEKLLKKEEFVFLSKSDLVSPKEIKNKLAALRPHAKNLHSISVYDPGQMEQLRKILNSIAETKHQPPEN